MTNRRPPEKIRHLMKLDFALFAQLEGLNPMNPTAPISKSGGMVFKDVLLIIGTCLILTLILFVSARFIVRNKQRQRPHEHRGRKPAPVRTANISAEEDRSDDRGRHRRRRRRRVRDHRPRNPTLAETGGLPPQKMQPPPQQSP